jgi:hypothetical protein
MNDTGPCNKVGVPLSSREGGNFVVMIKKSRIVDIVFSKIHEKMEFCLRKAEHPKARMSEHIGDFTEITGRV